MTPTKSLFEEISSIATKRDNSLLVESKDRNSVTIDICDSKSRVGSFTVGVSPAFATKDANYSSNGIWDCKNTQEKILEIPFLPSTSAL